MDRTAEAVSINVPSRARVALVARAIEPILNRVVLAGPPVMDLLVDDPSMRGPELRFASDATLQLLSTSMVDRLGADLQRLGFSRAGRTRSSDRWSLPTGESVDLVQVREDQSDPAQLWLEYATLMTLPHRVDEHVVVRIAGAPAMLAIELDAFARSGARALDSEELERAVVLIAGRTEVERECATAPPELRALIANALAAIASNDALELVVQRAIPDAMLVPELAKRVRRRIVRMAC